MVSLAEARENALGNRKLARSGGDPLAEKRRLVGIPIFAEAAKRVGEQKRAGWRSAAHARNWFRTLEIHAFPRIGDVPVSEVTSGDVLDILNPIWHTKPPTARFVHMRVRAVLEWAIAMEWRTDNPCDRILHLLGPQHDAVTHRKALPRGEVAAAIEKVRAAESAQAGALAFEFMVLTAARGGEVRGAVWSEIILKVRFAYRGRSGGLLVGGIQCFEAVCRIGMIPKVAGCPDSRSHRSFAPDLL